jgi:hypothetical protein
MSNFGDVAFCVDCDRNAEAYRTASGAQNTGGPNEPPRRMAVKKDANGDGLCVQCLDLRRANRNAAFQLRVGATASANQLSFGTASTRDRESAGRPQILRIASAVRIPRLAVARPPAVAEPVEHVRVERVAKKAKLLRSQPAVGTKVKKVIARTKANQVGPAYPDAVWSRGPAVPTAKARVAKHPANASAMKDRAPKTPGPNLERVFMRVTAEIGIVRARVLLDQLRNRMRGRGSSW